MRVRSPSRVAAGINSCNQGSAELTRRTDAIDEVTSSIATGLAVSAEECIDDTTLLSAVAVDEGEGLAVQGEAGRLSNSAASDEGDNLVLAVSREGVLKGDEAVDHGGGVAVFGNAVGEEGALSKSPRIRGDGEAAGGVPGGGEGDFDVVALGEGVQPLTDGVGLTRGEVPDNIVVGGTSGAGDEAVVASGTEGVKFGGGGEVGVDLA